jgi:hypothetical protein
VFFPGRLHVLSGCFLSEIGSPRSREEGKECHLEKYYLRKSRPEILATNSKHVFGGVQDDS